MIVDLMKVSLWKTSAAGNIFKEPIAQKEIGTSVPGMLEGLC